MEPDSPLGERSWGCFPALSLCFLICNMGILGVSHFMGSQWGSDVEYVCSSVLRACKCSGTVVCSVTKLWSHGQLLHPCRRHLPRDPL